MVNQDSIVERLRRILQQFENVDDLESKTHNWSSDNIGIWKKLVAEIYSDVSNRRWHISKYRTVSFIRALDADGIDRGPLFMELLELGLVLRNYTDDPVR